MIAALLLSFGVIFVAELGDKSQLMAMTYALRYRWWVILLAITVATTAVHAVSVFFGHPRELTPQDYADVADLAETNGTVLLRDRATPLPEGWGVVETIGLVQYDGSGVETAPEPEAVRLTAADVLNTYDERELERVLREYGEERFAGKVAKAKSGKGGKKGGKGKGGKGGKGKKG